MSRPLKKNRLSGMVLDFVSLVPAGDNPEAVVVISKAAPDHDTPGGPMGQPISKDDLDPEVVAYIDGLESEVEDLTKSVEDLTTERDEALEAVSKAEESGLIVKSEEEQRKAILEKADPAVRMLIEKQEKDLEEVRKAAEAERDQRLTREYIAKAQSLPMLGEGREDFAGLLRRMAESLSPEDSATVEKMLTAANEQIAKGNLFTEMGRVGAETTTAAAESAAAEIKKADPTLTTEQALAKAYEQNPALLAEAMTTGQEG